MKKVNHLLFVGGILFLISACAQNNTIEYHFGGYSETLYTYEKNRDEESKKLHIQELKEIVNSEPKSKIPPGIRLELVSYLHAEGSDNATIQSLLNEEIQFYPESEVFVHVFSKNLK